MSQQNPFFQLIASELSIRVEQVAATAALLDEGGTVPFISRYRKEATDSLDEVAVAAIRDRLEQLAELNKRRDAIVKSMEERELMTEALSKAIAGAKTLVELEDIYLPYRPKRRTRAMMAREKGLGPLATMLMENPGSDPVAAASEFLNDEKGVASAEDALAGARDIIAEFANEHKETRERMRTLYRKSGQMGSKVVAKKEEEAAKFKDYFDWKEPIASAPSHRVLAMLRGEKEGFLSLEIAPEEEDALRILESIHFKPGPAGEQVRLALHDCYRRLLSPSMETEIRGELKKRSDEEAIRVFAENLRELLLAPPLGGKRVMALDPGFRTGCKLVCLDAQGKLLHHDVVYPHTGDRAAEDAKRKIAEQVAKYAIEAIAIGNGTAGRETEAFVRQLGFPASISIVLVNESGASIYSASDVAREEFPNEDLTVRGSVSIGRRLMDPLSELVKIDAKSIGVGQYQHDVDQSALGRSLDDVVTSCVNGVGVEVNTASRQLLTYVSGLGPQLAGNIIKFRDENGPFASRAQLKKVPRLGPKAFEQAAGFLRIREGKHPLDASAVHPESYGIVDQMAKDSGCKVEDLMRDESLRNQIVLENYVTDKVGLPTLTDIVAELAKPGRDPRKGFDHFSFAEGVSKMEDLEVGMSLPGLVTNVTAFGAFVDVGVHQDGLVHISQLSDNFVKNPADVVKVAQQVRVTVTEIDLPRKRIALSMKTNPGGSHQGASAKDRPAAKPTHQPKRQEQPRQQKPKEQANWFTDALKRKK